MSNITNLEFPKSGYRLIDGIKTFPELYISSEELAEWDLTQQHPTDELQHPILGLITEGASINSITVIETWASHCHGASCIFTVDHKHYGITFSWLTESDLHTITSFNPGDQTSIDNVKRLITRFN